MLTRFRNPPNLLRLPAVRSTSVVSCDGDLAITAATLKQRVRRLRACFKPVEELL